MQPVDHKRSPHWTFQVLQDFVKAVLIHLIVKEGQNVCHLNSGGGLDLGKVNSLSLNTNLGSGAVQI